MLNIFQYRLGLQIIPVSSSSIDEQGELEVLSSDGKLYLHNGSSISAVVTEFHASQGTNRLKNKDLEDSTLAIVDSSDTTKKILLDAAGTTGTSTTLQSSQTSNRILILPDASGTLVVSSGSIISNAKLDDSTVFFVDTGDTTKEFHIDVAGTTGTKTTLLTTQTTDRVLTLPDLTDNLVSRTSTDTLTNKSLALSSNTVSSTASRAAEFNGSGNLSPSAVTTTELGYVSGVTSSIQTQLNSKGDVFTTAVQTLTNKSLEDSTTFIIDNLDNTKKVQFQASGITTGTTRTFTLPDITDTLITRTSTDTGTGRLKNKDLEDTTTAIVKNTNTTSKLIFDLSLQNNGITTTIQPLSSSGRLIQLPNSDALLVGTDVQQVLTNKDIDGGTASNTNRITIPKNTKTNLDSLTRKEATIVYASDEDKFYGDDGTTLFPIGSGNGSGINYIENPDADSGTTGFATYADAAGSEPVNGTGGVAGITFTVNTTTPLRGPNDFQLSKGASNLQGNGVSYDFTIDNQDKNKKFKIEFDYAGTTNFVAGSSSDVRVFIYDITNNTLIRPERTTLTTGAGTYVSSFYASSSTSYRIIFHVATTSALAYDLHLDRISVGPSENSLLVGPSIGDFTSYTPTFTGFGTPTGISFRYRQVGDAIEIQGTFTSGVPTSVPSQITLPLGLITDSTIPTIEIIGRGGRTSTSGLDDLYVVTGTSQSYIQLTIAGVSGFSPFTVPNTDAIIGNGNLVSIFAKVKITNWTANTAIAPSGVIRISEILANGTRVTGTSPVSLGQYRSYLRANGSTTFSETNGSPTITPSISNGIAIYHNNAGDSNNNPSKYDIFVGKFKSVKLQFYPTTGRTGFIDVTPGTTPIPQTQIGFSSIYDPTTGIVTVLKYTGDNTTNPFDSGRDNNGDLVATSPIYFDIAIADNDFQIQLSQERSSANLNGGNGYGSTNTKIRRFTNSTITGSAITYTDSATLGTSFIINEAGLYHGMYHDLDSANGLIESGFSLNTTQPTTDLNAINNADILAFAVQTGGSSVAPSVFVRYLVPGDIVRPHGNGVVTATTTTTYARMSLTKISN